MANGRPLADVKFGRPHDAMTTEALIEDLPDRRTASANRDAAGAGDVGQFLPIQNPDPTDSHWLRNQWYFQRKRLVQIPPFPER